MLTRAHAIADIDFPNTRITADCLMQLADGNYLALAGKMLDIFRSGIGKPRGVLHREVETLFHGLDWGWG